MIQLETLSGQHYDKIYLNETDFKYGDIRNHIMKNIKRQYPEYNPSSDFEDYTMYVKTDIKLFNKGNLINFDDDISFDKEDSVLQIFIKYEYICYYNYYNCKIYNFTEENRYEKIVDLIKIDELFINLLTKEEQTEEICKLAVQQNGGALEFVKIDQTEELCKLAVQQDSFALQFVINQTEEICKLAVQKNGNALSFVKIEQTEELCKLAVQNYGNTLSFVKIEQTEELCKLAVQENVHVFKFVKNQTEELCKLAVQKDGWSLKYVKNQTEEICKLAVKQDGFALQYVKEQTEEHCNMSQKACNIYLCKKLNL